MTIITWRPYVCDCIISYNQNIVWVESIQKCRLHKRLNGQFHLDTVLSMAHRFDRSHGLEPTELEEREIELSRTINKMRIRVENLDNFHEHLPDHHDLTFFENLKDIISRLNPF